MRLFAGLPFSPSSDFAASVLLYPHLYPVTCVALTGTILLASQPGALPHSLTGRPAGTRPVIVMVDGNRLRIVAAFRERDSVQCVRRVAFMLRERQLTSFVSADAGVLAAPCAPSSQAISASTPHESITA